MTRERVFVTGMGVVSPVGNSVAEAFQRVYAGESAVRRVEPEGEARREAALLATADFDVEGVIPRRRARLMARVSHMAVLAARDALVDAGFGADAEAPTDHGPGTPTGALSSMGVYTGCALGGSEALEDHYRAYEVGPPKRSRAATVPMIMANGPASHISMHFGATGPTVNYSVACVSSAMALGEAFRTIRDGYQHRILAGGTEAQLFGGTVAAWLALRALAREHADGPHASSRPFDADRTGLVLGEGAAMLVLESETAMERRGATPLAEVVGYGGSSDAHDLTAPRAETQAGAMRNALADAGLPPEAIGYVNAHATGTPVGDRVEILALRQTFGAHADALAVSSTKGVHGHLIGATGALEAVWTVCSLRSSRVPPTANLTNPDPECDLDLVPNVGRDMPDLRYAISNSFGFGGANAALVFKKV